MQLRRWHGSAKLARSLNPLNLSKLSLGTSGVTCLIDQKYARLPFASREGALQFIRLAALYVNDAAPGNSYGGIFPCSDTPQILFFPKPLQHFDEAERLNRMTTLINHKRLMLNYYEPLPIEWENSHPTARLEDGRVVFNFNEQLLAPRRLPTTFGEFVQVVEDPHYRRVTGYFIAKVGACAVLALPFAEQDSLPRFVTVPIGNTMCVRNYWRESPFGWQLHGAKHEALLREASEMIRTRGAQQLVATKTLTS